MEMASIGISGVIEQLDKVIHTAQIASLNYMF
jgi:hypothetical protein